MAASKRLQKVCRGYIFITFFFWSVFRRHVNKKSNQTQQFVANGIRGVNNEDENDSFISVTKQFRKKIEMTFWFFPQFLSKNWNINKTHWQLRAICLVMVVWYDFNLNFFFPFFSELGIGRFKIIKFEVISRYSSRWFEHFVMDWSYNSGK